MFNRRDFLKLAAAFGGGQGGGLAPQARAALNKIDPRRVPKLLCLQGLSCTGCSISLLQAETPSAMSMITQYSQLVFHTDLSSTSGAQAMELINAFIDGEAGDYVLAIEGAIPEDMPSACIIDHKPFAHYLERAAVTMSGAVAIGSCACDGGIPAAEGNPTGAIGLAEFYRKRNINRQVINIPGCPVHPDWVWHTINHLVLAGSPKLINGSPEAFFDRRLHEHCPRYYDFQEENFAKKLGDRGCLFKLGCLGPITFADCPTRRWNGGHSWCVNANAPCIGCASPRFARQKSLPFYRLSEGKTSRRS